MIFLTGGTGFVGGNLMKELLNQGFAIRCLVRNSAKAESLKKMGVEIVQGDVTDKSSVIKALSDGKVTTAIHLVGILAEVGKATFTRIHTEGTKNVVDACKEAGVKRYIHISALGTRPNARSEYHRTKWEAEEIIRASGLDYTIFRPSVLFGKEDKFTNLFGGIMKIFPVIMIPGSGKNMMQPVFVKDLIAAMVAAVKDAKHVNKVYELGGAQKLTFDEIIDMIGKVLGKSRLKIHIPMLFMWPGAAILETVLPRPPITRDQLLMLEEDNVTDQNALETVFGIRPVRFEEGMREYLR